MQKYSTFFGVFCRVQKYPTFFGVFCWVQKYPTFFGLFCRVQKYPTFFRDILSGTKTPHFFVWSPDYQRKQRYDFFVGRSIGNFCLVTRSPKKVAFRFLFWDSLYVSFIWSLDHQGEQHYDSFTELIDLSVHVYTTMPTSVPDEVQLR